MPRQNRFSNVLWLLLKKLMDQTIREWRRHSITWRYCTKLKAKYSDAEPLYKRALSIWEKRQGPTHPDVAYALNNLGVLYYVQGRHEEAKPLYERALVIREQALGPEHPDVGQSLENLADLYQKMGDLEKVIDYAARAKKIREMER